MILCIGMMVQDTILSGVPSDILRRDSVGIAPPVISCGGDALNVAIGAAKLNQSAAVAGYLGNDMAGRFILTECRKHKVCVESVIVTDEYPTAQTYVLVDDSGERHFLSERSIFSALRAQDIQDEILKNADIVYFGSAMTMPEMDRGGIADIFYRAHQLNKLTVMDAAINEDVEECCTLQDLESALKETDIFFPSMHEAKRLTGRQEPMEIAEYFRRFDLKLFGIKMGRQGCFATDFKKAEVIPCVPDIIPADTTGAGDSFMAGLVTGIELGWDFSKSVRFAVCVAAMSIERTGGTGGIPALTEAKQYYENYREYLGGNAL